MLSIYPVTWLAQRVGKTQTLKVAFALVFAGAAGKWFLYTPGHEWKILFDPLLCGPVWIAINVLTQPCSPTSATRTSCASACGARACSGDLFVDPEDGYSTAFFGAFLSLKLTGFDAALGGDQSPARFCACG